MKIQERIIRQSLLQDTCDFPDIINLEYFADDDLRVIMTHIRDLSTNGSVSMPLLKEKVYSYQKSIKYAERLCERSENILDNDNLSFIYGNVNDQLMDEYSLLSIRKCVSIFKDDSYTLSQRVNSGIDILNRCNDDVSNNYEYSFKDERKGYLYNMDNGIEDSYITKSIKLEDDNLCLLFDDYLRPFMYGIAARPADYKTTIAINLVNHLLDMGKNGLFFSMEDSHETLRNKLMSAKTCVDKERINRMDLSEHDKKILKISDQTGDLFIIDKLVSRHDLRRLAIKYHRKHKIDFICIDYLQKIIIDNKRRHEEIGLFCQEILNIIKLFQIPVIAITQLNRDSEGDGEPFMRHIKDSGDIEQDCRVIIASWSTTEQRDEGNTDRYIKHLKNTWGSLGYKSIVFEPKSGRIEHVYKMDRKDIPDNKKRYKM